jgi:hypothetical protein
MVQSWDGFVDTVWQNGLTIKMQRTRQLLEVCKIVPEVGSPLVVRRAADFGSLGREAEEVIVPVECDDCRWGKLEEECIAEAKRNSHLWVGWQFGRHKDAPGPNQAINATRATTANRTTTIREGACALSPR